MDSRQPQPQNTDEEEDDAEEEVSCFKKVLPNGTRQVDLSAQHQRDVAVLMGDTPSPAPSVVSIRSELTDGDDEGGEPPRCRLNQSVRVVSLRPVVFLLCFNPDLDLVVLRCKEECGCEACTNTSVSMDRVCSLSSPDSSLSTSSFASNSLQSSPSASPCKRPNR